MSWSVWNFKNPISVKKLKIEKNQFQSVILFRNSVNTLRHSHATSLVWPLHWASFETHTHNDTNWKRQKLTKKRNKKTKNHDSRGIYVFTSRTTGECFQLLHGHQRTQTNNTVNMIYRAYGTWKTKLRPNRKFSGTFSFCW